MRRACLPSPSPAAFRSSSSDSESAAPVTTVIISIQNTLQRNANYLLNTFVSGSNHQDTTCRHATERSDRLRVRLSSHRGPDPFRQEHPTRSRWLAPQATRKTRVSQEPFAASSMNETRTTITERTRSGEPVADLVGELEGGLSSGCGSRPPPPGPDGPEAPCGGRSRLRVVPSPRPAPRRGRGVPRPVGGKGGLPAYLL